MVASAAGGAPHRLEIRNELDELRRMSAWLDSACTALAIDDELRFKLDLCANEAVTNIISYAFAAPGDHAIVLELDADAERIELRCLDDGAAFDPFAAVPAAPAGRLEDAAIGGWGLSLIRKLLPESRYERRDGRNLLRIAARRAGAAGHG